jgi:hypothetical protein
MNIRRKERRKYERYDTEAKVYFRVRYDLKTKVEFQLIDKSKKRLLSKKYPGISRNVSAEGMRFSSDKKLRKGTDLYLEVYLPKRKDPIYMTGEVKWSKKLFIYPKDAYEFDTGVKLKSIMGEPVSKTIYFDKKYGVFWSSVLNYVFGSFRECVQKDRGNILTGPT